MKNIKGWRLFLEELEEELPVQDVDVEKDSELDEENNKVKEESLKSIGEDLQEYRQKKQIVQDIFKDLDKTEDEINKELRDKVYNNKKEADKRNVYLVQWESLFRMQRNLEKLKNSIQNLSNKKIEVNNTMSELMEYFNELTEGKQKLGVSQQIEKNRKYLKDLDMKLTNNKKQLSISEKNYQTKMKSFNDRMKLEEQKIINLSKK